ncbi:MAG: hypothetical protein RLZZ28_1091 [Bacteroidota bacterium]|jgi:hypothetical protein
MNRQLFLFGLFFISTALNAQVPARKLDTTMKVGKAGYRLSCFNKSAERNSVTISPIGFEKDVREFSFEVKGRITKGEVDDVNRDGYPDLVFYVFSGDSLPRGSVVALTSEKNEGINSIAFPDIFDDPKLRVGYKGNDEFTLMEGNLVRRFPVYPPDSLKATAKGIMYRQVQYMVVPGDRGGSRFKPLRSYEFTKQ